MALSRLSKPCLGTTDPGDAVLERKEAVTMDGFSLKFARIVETIHLILRKFIGRPVKLQPTCASCSTLILWERQTAEV